jgi:hypothetical protein
MAARELRVYEQTLRMVDRSTFMVPSPSTDGGLAILVQHRGIMPAT